MFEQDLLDEESKKKKRRILVVLLVFLLGTGMMLPMVVRTTSPVAAVPEAVTETPTRTTVPTELPAPPTREPTEMVAATTTPRPTATSTPVPVAPTVTEEQLGGAGGGEPDASPAPTGAPELAAPTPKPSELLPVTGASTGGSGQMALGLAVVLLGALLLMVGLVLHTRR